jgi:hypothetical protein
VRARVKKLVVDQNMFETPEEEDTFVSSMLTDGEGE